MGILDDEIEILKEKSKRFAEHFEKEKLKLFIRCEKHILLNKLLQESYEFENISDLRQVIYDLIDEL